MVKHLDHEAEELINGTRYRFFRRRNVPWQIPFKTHRYIRSQKPDIILVHGFIFPLQVIALRMAVGKSCRIMLQHHGDQPAASARKIFQQWADKYIAAYLFTSIDIAIPWIEHKIIRDKNKCHTVLEASTFIQKKDKLVCKAITGMSGDMNFLWVGRLNANKDPLTVLNGFYQHVLLNPRSHLYMIYQTEDLLGEIKKLVKEYSILQTNVHLVGKIPHDKLADWYSAADIFISGSHRESSGYALLEAMHCGCIPVVTDIPSFNKMTEGGKYCFLYEPGNAEALTKILDQIQLPLNQLSDKIYTYAKNNLGFKNIADQLYKVFEKVMEH